MFNIKLKLPRYQGHINKPHNDFATVFKNKSVSSSTFASASGEPVWPVPITVDAESVSSSCMSLLDAVAAVVDLATDGDSLQL